MCAACKDYEEMKANGDRQNKRIAEREALLEPLEIQHIEPEKAMEREPEIIQTKAVLSEEEVVMACKIGLETCGLDVLCEVYNLLGHEFPIRVRTVYGIDGQGDEPPTFILK